MIDDSRSPVDRFGPLGADHPSVGIPCVVCKIALEQGDIPSLISLAPADEEEAEKQRQGRAFNAVAGISHQDCAWPGERRRAS